MVATVITTQFTKKYNHLHFKRTERKNTTMNNTDRITLSKKMSYALRHCPEEFGLDMAPDASVFLDDLLKALEANTDDILYVVRHDNKGRFSYNSETGRIWCKHGHTIDGVNPDLEIVDSSVSDLPEVLYHGTKDQFIKSVMKDGLKHMDRNFVHLTPSKETARSVADRRSGKSIILKVNMRDLLNSKYTLYKSGEVYLIEHVASDLLSFA